MTELEQNIAAKFFTESKYVYMTSDDLYIYIYIYIYIRDYITILKRLLI